MWRKWAAFVLLTGVTACGAGEPPEADGVDDAEPPSAAGAPAVTTITTEAGPSTTDMAAGPVLFADHLATGTCFDEQFDEDGDYDYSRPPLIVDCSEPHDAEVALVTEYPAGPDDPYPGEDALDDFFDDACVPAFEDYVGTTGGETALSGYYMSPGDEQEWSTGSRSYACILYLPDARLRGSVAGAGGNIVPADLPEDAPLPEDLTLSFVNPETDSSPGDNDWGVDPEGLKLARFRHEAPAAEVKEAFLEAVAAGGWTIERRRDYGSLDLSTEFFDLRKEGKQLVIEVWELESGATSLEYFYRPEPAG